MLKQRVLTALVLAPLMIVGIFFLSSTYFPYFIMLIVALASWEWAKLSGFTPNVIRVGYAVAIVLFGYMTLRYGDDVQSLNWTLRLAVIWWVIALICVLTFPKAKMLWNSKIARLVIGVFVIVPMWIGLVMLKGMGDDAEYYLVWLMCLVWGADSGAYFAGRHFGKTKLAEKISPKKTWEGVYGGMLTAMIFSVIAAVSLFDVANYSILDWTLLVVMSVVVVFISVVGDLFESLLKRHENIKDSSQLLPGHGGVMDRVDSLVAAVPFFVLFIPLFIK
ncbi:MAG: phosphatidate cytidylyltransferase [Saccharospirillaceae bacterium]|nr:phosphatidate cytidylyltransferase [Pseudomonadales bacterium]NRB78601.1 phosphatidate cytidylyltransferase [Saccharospirillaceae bacterium]